MEPLKLELLDGLSCLRPLCPSIPLFSTVTGQAITGADLDASYWWRNVRSPVLFAAAVAELKAGITSSSSSSGPHPALAGSISECFVGSEIEPTVFASLRRHEPDQVTMLAAVARLYSVGYPIDWKLLDSGGGRIARLPRYPWQRERHWNECERLRLDRVGPCLTRYSDAGSSRGYGLEQRA